MLNERYIYCKAYCNELREKTTFYRLKIHLNIFYVLNYYKCIYMWSFGETVLTLTQIIQHVFMFKFFLSGSML